MSFEENKAIIQRSVDAFNQGNLDIIDEAISRDFYNHVPAPGEVTAPEVLRQFGRDLLAAFPDLKISVADFVDQGDTLTFSMTMSGTRANDLWGAPGTGKYTSWTSTVTSRVRDGKFTMSWEDLALPSIIGTLREIDLVPPPDMMDQPYKYPVTPPEFLLKVVFNGQVADKECAHLDNIQITETTTDVCNDCVALGDVWPALRMCLICGYVGCCDTSKNKHMKQHFEKTDHAIFRSIRLEESWVWCYEDDAFFSGEILEKYG